MQNWDYPENNSNQRKYYSLYPTLYNYNVQPTQQTVMNNTSYITNPSMMSHSVANRQQHQPKKPPKMGAQWVQTNSQAQWVTNQPMKRSGSSSSGFKPIQQTHEYLGCNNKARIQFPLNAPYPQLLLDSRVGTTNKSILFSLPPTISLWHLTDMIQKFHQNTSMEKKDQIINMTALYIPEEMPEDLSTLVPFSETTLFQDLIRAGLRTKKLDPLTKEYKEAPGFYLIIENGLNEQQRIWVDLPTFSNRIAEHEEEIEVLKQELKPLEDLKALCDRKARRYSQSMVYGGFLGLLGQWLLLGRLTWWEYSWDVIEPITWFVTTGNSILAYAFFLIYKRDFAYETFSSLTATRRQIILYKKMGLNFEKYEQCKAEILRLKNEIESIRRDYE